MRHFLAELRRRNVLRAGALYIAGLWALAQGISQLGPAFGAPEWSTRWFVIAGAIGLPFWLAFAWLYELTPEGLKRESEIAADASISRQTDKTLDRWIIGILAVAVVLLTTNTFVWRKGTDIGMAATSGAPVDAPIPSIESDPSIAVLPFINMSSDTENQYFSDGISEELLNLLARVPKLRVIARTSSFSFRGKDAAIADIARKLHVSALLEGSVRKSGKTVRITVQLIRASDSTHLWSEDYDRTLDDIFKVQDDIAAMVVGKLKIKLLGIEPTVAALDPKAYPLILQAEALADQNAVASLTQAETVYREALAIAPDASRAWSGLGRVYLSQTLFSERESVEGTRLAKEALNKALLLNPNDGLTYSRLAHVLQQMDNDQTGGAPLIQKALALDPGNLGVIANAAAFLLSLGRLDQALALFEYGVDRDPANANAYADLGNTQYYARQWDAAIATNRTALSLSPDYAQAHYNIGAALLLGKHDPGGALSEFQAETNELTRMSGLPIALDALGRKAESDAALSALIAGHDRDGASCIAIVYAQRGDLDGAFAWLEKARSQHDSGLPYVHFEPMFDPLHEDARWLPLLRTMGLAPEQLDKIVLKVALPKND